jgi:hypothetical protein
MPIYVNQCMSASTYSIKGVRKRHTVARLGVSHICKCLCTIYNVTYITELYASEDKNIILVFDSLQRSVHVTWLLQMTLLSCSCIGIEVIQVFEDSSLVRKVVPLHNVPRIQLKVEVHKGAS